GDEDMDWTAELDDVGADGVPNTHDTGEGDGIPTLGEPNFDKTDLDESDQIGLTGFKMSRIRAGLGNPDPTTDNVLFYTDANNWPTSLRQVHQSLRSGTLRFGGSGQLQHRVPVRLRSLPIACRPARALQPGTGLRRGPPGAARDRAHRAA